jgi:hypothetical protein
MGESNHGPDPRRLESLGRCRSHALVKNKKNYPLLGGNGGKCFETVWGNKDLREGMDTLFAKGTPVLGSDFYVRCGSGWLRRDGQVVPAYPRNSGLVARGKGTVWRIFHFRETTFHACLR